jgi:hypothetical protein
VKSQQVRVKMIYADGRTGMTKLNVAFRCFSKVSGRRTAALLHVGLSSRTSDHVITVRVWPAVFVGKTAVWAAARQCTAGGASGPDSHKVGGRLPCAQALLQSGCVCWGCRRNSAFKSDTTSFTSSQCYNPISLYVFVSESQGCTKFTINKGCTLHV